MEEWLALIVRDLMHEVGKLVRRGVKSLGKR